MKELFSKKDPVLLAILYENAITFTSTSIPLLCQSFKMQINFNAILKINIYKNFNNNNKKY